MHEPITEHVNLAGAATRVDRAAGVIHGVKILGLASKNGRVYRREALERAIPLYEAARVNVNHPKGAPGAPRGYEERIGTVRNILCRDEGLFGDFHFNPKHRLAEQLLWDAQHMPENVGFSHNVLARTSKQDGQTVVEEIASVQSVDLVADPATTRGLFEHADPQDVEPRVAALADENRMLREELASLRADVATFQQREAAARAIAEAELPAELVTETFLEQCREAGDAQSLHRLIDARRTDAQLLAAQRPRSIEQLERASEPADAASFARSVLT
jgi:hypothetical protein